VSAVEKARPLGSLALVALIIANTIGTGVFTTSGLSLASLGSREAVLLAWLVGGLHALLGVISYTWLVRRYPQSGGEYVLLSRSLHPGAGYVAGWVSLLAGFSAPIAAAAHGLEAYAGMPGTRWLGASVIIACAILHGLFSNTGVWLQNLAVGIKISLLLLLVVVGLSMIEIKPNLAALQATHWSQFGATCVWITFSYTGWNAAVYVAGEIRDREGGLMWAGIGAVGIVLLVYVGLNAVFLYAAPTSQLVGKVDVGRMAAEQIGGASGASFLAWLVVLALFTSISSMSMAGPRVAWQMARDGYLPSVFGRGGPPPTAAIFFQAALALTVFWFSSLEKILGMIGLTLILSSCGTVLGLFVEHYRTGWRPESPFYPFIPICFVVSTLAMGIWMAIQFPYQALASVLVLATGWVSYYFQKKQVQPTS
jgi:APA family basic amino acid/polyamine antiporter